MVLTALICTSNGCSSAPSDHLSNYSMIQGCNNDVLPTESLYGQTNSVYGYNQSDIIPAESLYEDFMGLGIHGGTYSREDLLFSMQDSRNGEFDPRTDEGKLLENKCFRDRRAHQKYYSVWDLEPDLYPLPELINHSFSCDDILNLVENTHDTYCVPQHTRSCKKRTRKCFECLRYEIFLHLLCKCLSFNATKVFKKKFFASISSKNL